MQVNTSLLTMVGLCMILWKQNLSLDNGKTITWDGQSRNAFQKSKEGGRGTKIWGVQRVQPLLIGQVINLYNLNDELIFDSLSFENKNRYSSGGNIGNMTNLHMKNFFESIRFGVRY